MKTFLPERFEFLNNLKQGRYSSTFLANDRKFSKERIVVRAFRKDQIRFNCDDLAAHFSWFIGVRHSNFANVVDVGDRVEAVDISSAAVALIRSNAERNKLKNIEAIEANAFDFLRDRHKQGARYDTIILDPPAFAKNKESLDAALRGYKEINNRAMRLLRPGGILITCSCSHHVSEGMFAEMLADAAKDAGCWARVLERRFQSADHPILMTVPETLYLKCFVLQILY